MRRRVGGSKTDRKSLRPVKIRVIPVEALLSTHLVSVHALIIDLDLALLAAEAGFVEEQLLRSHHLCLKDFAKASWTGIVATTQLRDVTALQSWDGAGGAVLAVHLLVLPNKHLSKFYFEGHQ